MEIYKVLVVYCPLLLFIPTFNALNSINPGQSIKENETLVSPAGIFEAGFFGNSNRKYLGIWFKNISPITIVWVANRDTPVGNSSGVLEVTNGGNLVILDGSRARIWSSNTSTTAQNPVVELLDSGNLAVKEANNSDNFLWQSFDSPGDTLLPGMKIRSSMVSGMHTSLTSWRDNNDPADGDWSYHIDTHGLPQMVITKGQTLFYRSGSWNGFHFSDVPSETLYRFFNFSFVITDEEAYYTYKLLNDSIVTRFIINPYGLVQRFIWSDRDMNWQIISVGPLDQCDNYAVCGTNSVCNISNSPICVCLRGFVQNSDDTFDGCIRGLKLDCDDKDGFVKYAGMKLPETSFSWFDKNMNLEECEKLCLQNCSCSAYANLDLRNGGSGCVLWFGDIVDTRIMPSEGQDLYIRVPQSELDFLDNTKNKRKLNKKQLVGILLGCAVFIIGLTILGVVFYLRRKKLKKQEKNETNNWKVQSENNEKEDIDIPSFDLSTIANATDQFSISNKLGEGGFGPVYKGTLADGQVIAVKRLSNNSGQGPEEFKNEVELIANLQHRNLVKLLGCCIHDDERLLIYEYMPNRSLDYFIFDKTKSNYLSWTQHFQIICGIARGLLYLHEDSKLRIIHRDLKTSNILLDKNMNPKISDFGLVRIFGGDQDEAKTKRVVGTYGYMPPEYAIRGWFSVKSDVFSFGVIILEILSGRRNRDFSDPCHDLDLLGHAWRLWCEERSLKLIDESLGNSVTQAEVLRSIHIGLLCVQEKPEDRPDMSSVVLMLNGEKPLPMPRQPAFYPHKPACSTGKGEQDSTNEMSISMLNAR